MGKNLHAKALPWKDNIGYSIGNIGSNLIFGMITFHMLYFYTDVMGISAATVGILFLVARIWDAINDPIMGYLVDRTHTRWGKFRPFILIGTVPCTIIYVLTFYTPDLSQTGKVIWAFATYIPLGMIVTFINIPYHAQSTIMTKNPHERADLGAVSNIMALLATLIVASVTLPLVESFSSPQRGFAITTIIFSVGIISCYLITFVVTKRYDLPDRVFNQPYRTEITRFTIKKAQVLTQNRPLLSLMFCYFFFQVGSAITASTSIYLFKYYLKRPELYPTIMGLYLMMMAVGMLFVPAFSRRIGKKRLFHVSNFIAAISISSPFLLLPFFDLKDPQAFSIWGPLIGAIFLVGALGNGPVVALVWGMIPDTVEYAELKVGIRSEGLIFASLSFMMKAGLAVGGVLAGIALTVYNYVPNQIQSDRTLFGILLLSTAIPAVIRLLCNVSMFFYNLTEKKFEVIVAKLDGQL